MATEAHGDAVDKAGLPYILHPLAVMLSLVLSGNYTEDELIVAVLHDTLEDTKLTEKDISDKFGFGVLIGVQGVSRRFIHKTTGEILYHEPTPMYLDDYEKETYTDFIKRAGRDSVSRKVKKADIFHNMSPTRMNQLPLEMRGISKRYKKGLLQLGVSEEEIALFLEGK